MPDFHRATRHCITHCMTERRFLCIKSTLTPRVFIAQLVRCILPDITGWLDMVTWWILLDDSPYPSGWVQWTWNCTAYLCAQMFDIVVIKFGRLIDSKGLNNPIYPASRLNFKCDRMGRAVNFYFKPKWVKYYSYVPVVIFLLFYCCGVYI